MTKRERQKKINKSERYIKYLLKKTQHLFILLKRKRSMRCTLIIAHKIVETGIKIRMAYANLLVIKETPIKRIGFDPGSCGDSRIALISKERGCEMIISGSAGVGKHYRAMIAHRDIIYTGRIHNMKFNKS